MTTTAKPSFVYVTYIATTAEKVWQAVVDPDVARKYWVGGNSKSPAHVNVSDWKAGSKWEHQCADESHAVDIAGKVVECTPPRRLVLSWARPAEVGDASKLSRVTFDIEQNGEGLIRLTVTHEDLENDAKMLAGISGGWPQVLSNLKTYLETGRPLPQNAPAS